MHRAVEGSLCARERVATMRTLHERYILKRKQQEQGRKRLDYLTIYFYIMKIQQPSCLSV